MKFLLFLTSVSTFFTYFNVSAEVFHWPQICPDGNLIVKNNSSVAATFWLQKFNNNLIRETEMEVSAKSSFVFNLAPLAKGERYALLNINSEQAIEVSYHCPDRRVSASSIEGGELHFRRGSTGHNQIWVQNLFTEKNKIRIEFLDQESTIVGRNELELTSLQSIFIDEPQFANWSYFKISSDHKSSIFYLISGGNEKPLSVSPQKTEVNPAAFYFLVGPRTGLGDSFIVKITNEKMLIRARDLIAHPHREKMLFARIQKSHFGFNRNWSNREKSFWSWSVSEVTNFDDLGSTACNGSPQEVEDRMDFWVHDPGQICFWNYRVKKELTPLEVARGL